MRIFYKNNQMRITNYNKYKNENLFTITMESKTKTTLFTLGYNNRLLTEREGRTGEYWPEVVAVWTSLPRPRANIPQYGSSKLC